MDPSKVDIDEEFNEFLFKVGEIGSIIKSLGSEDKTEVQHACKKADKLLMNMDMKNLKDNSDRDAELYVKADKTLVNKIIIPEEKAISSDSAHIAKAETERNKNMVAQGAFLACISKDAVRRSADKKRRKEKSNALKKEGNLAYRSGDYTRAFRLYTKAIIEVRDSCVLYTNRALACLQLESYKKALEDCKLALRLSPTSLKALVYKARAHKALGEVDLADSCVQEALNHHPQHTVCIKYAVNEHILTSK